tara:strand:+ start:2033 stop:2611 length:579 start_codon:yes stop_codon:yes gene_type:complete
VVVVAYTMAAAWQEETSKLLQRIYNRRDSEMFRDPVPWEALGLVDYLSVVKQPMDLGTVRSKLNGGEYANEDECVADIRLIWHNAMLYNAPGAAVYVKAKTLSEAFEAQWSTYRKNDAQRPASQQEMTEFSEKCYKLEPDDLGALMQLLETKCPSCLVKKKETNEVEVNVDLISGKAFREAERFVTSKLNAA